FALLHGPMAYLKHVTSRERLPFSIAYFGSLVATLYFAIGVNLN
ncbi:9592_t:CDS:1, partial [Entrophospora sp. SA101]